jgi:hypothetical protein
MHKVRRCIAFNDSAKKTRLLHGFNLALLGVLLCTTLLTGTTQVKDPAPADTQSLKRTELLFTDSTLTQREVLKLEYQAAPRVSVSGTRDQNGGFAFDVRIRKNW